MYLHTQADFGIWSASLCPKGLEFISTCPVGADLQIRIAKHAQVALEHVHVSGRGWNIFKIYREEQEEIGPRLKRIYPYNFGLRGRHQRPYLK